MRTKSAKGLSRNPRAFAQFAFQEPYHCPLGGMWRYFQIARTSQAISKTAITRQQTQTSHISQNSNFTAGPINSTGGMSDPPIYPFASFALSRFRDSENSPRTSFRPLISDGMIASFPFKNICVPAITSEKKSRVRIL